eukprot:827132-Rhodomonas_salina.1
MEMVWRVIEVALPWHGVAEIYPSTRVGVGNGTGENKRRRVPGYPGYRRIAKIPGYPVILGSEASAVVVHRDSTHVTRVGRARKAFHDTRVPCRNSYPGAVARCANV